MEFGGHCPTQRIISLQLPSSNVLHFLLMPRLIAFVPFLAPIIRGQPRPPLCGLPFRMKAPDGGGGSAMAPQRPSSPSPSPPSSPPLSTAATTGTSDIAFSEFGASDFAPSDFGSTVDEFDASVEDVLARISALTTSDDVPAPTAAAQDQAQSKREDSREAQRVRVIYSDKFLDHESPRGGHPERPERLQVIVAALRADERLRGLVDWVEPTGVEEGSVRRELVLELIGEVHTFEQYLTDVRMMSEGNGGFVDGDTYVAKGSYEVALLAVSAWIDAVDCALGGEGPAWALARPPGHHATRVTGMGFCLFANAGIAAQYALRRVGHVAIVDYDVHHGTEPIGDLLFSRSRLAVSEPRVLCRSLTFFFCGWVFAY